MTLPHVSPFSPGYGNESDESGFVCSAFLWLLLYFCITKTVLNLSVRETFRLWSYSTSYPFVACQNCDEGATKASEKVKFKANLSNKLILENVLTPSNKCLDFALGQIKIFYLLLFKQLCSLAHKIFFVHIYVKI